MYKYEMHQHTYPCSHCGKADPEKLVYALKECGFDGVVLTNHFLHGNTGIDKDLPWAEFVKYYEDDYLTAKKVGDSIGIDVIFGIEEHIGDGREVLLYGITPEFMYAHPEMSDGKLETISKAVHEFGGLVFQAHPYRDRDYIPNPKENIAIEYLDGFETYNAANQGNENVEAEAFAVEHGLMQTAGSDAHHEEMSFRYGIECERRIKDSFELAEILKSGDYKLYLEDIK
ncbi:MAG: hypothetical protein KBT46_07120 [Ruminococcus sp.]|nr:hypothetical protein [Candidatus Copronaster equi]